MYRANVNVNSIVENAIQIKSGITINVDVSVKIRKKHVRIIVGILAHIFGRTVGI